MKVSSRGLRWVGKDGKWTEGLFWWESTGPSAVLSYNIVAWSVELLRIAAHLCVAVFPRGIMP